MQVSGQKVSQRGEKGQEGIGRNAERPGQTLNLDICFVPTEHQSQEKLPAVSGSSGHLVVERLSSCAAEHAWPGQVFREKEMDYTHAMLSYVAATRDRLVRQNHKRKIKLAAEVVWREAVTRRIERFHLREQRKKEDAGWQKIRVRHHTIVETYRALSQRRRQAMKMAWEAELDLWNQLKGQRKKLLDRRRQQNQAWHQRHQKTSSESANPQHTRSWIAILVVTDNCTRQCLALPAFRSGARLSSDEVVLALRTVLPTEVEFLITDQGTHFRSIAFAQLAQGVDFIHVPVYRHRPQTNGIAERFVLTLKQWLRNKSWQSASDVETFLAQFHAEYNDRPHLGLPIPGLSPNEFANRIWIM